MMPVGPRDLPKARVIVADPPWQFDDKLPGDGRGAAKHYETLSLSDIMRFPLPDLAEPCLLALWRVASMQQEALDVIRAWGFSLKTEIVWKKMTKNGAVAFGMGRITRGAHEVCLLATRGGRFHVKDKSVRSIFDTIEFEAEVGEHSEKPAIFYEILERLAGEGPFYELFARQGRPGWHTFGNEIPGGYVWTPPAPVGVVVSSGTLVEGSTEKLAEDVKAIPGAHTVTATEEKPEALFLPCSNAQLRRRFFYGLTLVKDERSKLIAQAVAEGYVSEEHATGYDLGDPWREVAFRLACQGAPVGFFPSDLKEDADYPNPIQTNGDLVDKLAARGVKVPVIETAKLVGSDAEAVEFFALFGGPVPPFLSAWVKPALAGPTPAQEGGKGRGRGRGKGKAGAASEEASKGASEARDEDAVRRELEAPPELPGAIPPFERIGSAETWIVARVRASDHVRTVASLDDAAELAAHGPQDFGGA